MKGKITNYTNEKKFGFIKGEDGKNYFFHVSSVKDDIAYIIKGNSVEFNPEMGKKGLKAENIRKKKKNLHTSLNNLEYSNRRLIKGIKKGLNIKGNTEEILITEKFSNYFGITFSREEVFKDKVYRFNFIQPSETYQKSFNMFNEVIMLFSPFNTYDNRAMDFVDKSFIEYSNRLDKILVILVSKDSHIQESIPRDSESRIIVPFNYAEIIDSTFNEDLIKSRLRDYFYQRDLFAMESPLKTDNYFYGRKDIVHNLYAKYTIGENSGLFGLRKTGKTSVLFAIERTIKTENGLSIYIDCQDTAINKLRWYELFEEIITLLDEKYNFGILKTSNLNFNESRASRSFVEYMKKVFARNNQRILIIFDEIEHISFDLSDEQHWKEGKDYQDFWRSIRAKTQSNPELFSFIIAGVNPRVLEIASVKSSDNPIFNFASRIYLDLFKLEDVDRMVTDIGGYMGIDFEKAVIAKLHENYGGHPFLIRNVCSLLSSKYKNRPYTINKRDYADNKKDIDLELSSYIQSIVLVLKKWYSIEFDILKDISLENESMYLDEIKKNPNSINHLLSYGVVMKSLGNNYYIEIDAIRSYMKSEFRKEYIPSEKKEIRQLISIRRNEIEEKLREIVKIGLKMKYPQNAIKKQLKKYVDLSSVESRRESGEIWDGMYFDELRKIINGEFDVFKNILDINQTTFNEAMQKINKYRSVDAHADSVTKEEYEELHINFNVLEKALGVEKG